jgi:hypothetical protein
LNKKLYINQEILRQRNDEIYEDIKELWEKSEDMKQIVFEMKMKLERVENKLGYVSQLERL